MDYIIIIIAICIIVAIIHTKKKEAERKYNRELYRLIHNSDIENYVPDLTSTTHAPIDVAVKGISYRTPDEIFAARMCNVGDTVVLLPEPCNKIDSYAVKVMTMEGFHIGYVSAEYSKLVSSNIEHIAKCVIVRATKHDIPFIYLRIEFSAGAVKQSTFIKKEYQCGPEDKMRNLSTKPIDSYDYRRVLLFIQDLYERDRAVIAKARACRKGDKIILKKGVCDELYPYRIDAYLSDGTYLGYVEDFGRKEVYTLFDNIVDVFVDYPISSETAYRLGIRVIFPNNLKCPTDCLPSNGISFHYGGNYPEVAKAREIRRSDPLAALDMLMPIVEQEKGIEAHLECVACYYQLKEWESRIAIIQKMLDRIDSLNEEDLPPPMLRQNLIEANKLMKQLEFSQKRLEAQNKKRRT